MTTAVVGALLHYLVVVNLSSSKDQHQEKKDATDLDVVHMIAQTNHCIAQGKVGSGFDVSSAVYSSHHHVRQSSSCPFFTRSDLSLSLSLCSITVQGSNLPSPKYHIKNKNKKKHLGDKHMLAYGLPHFPPFFPQIYLL